MSNPNPLPQIALVTLPSPPPPGSIQFFDGYFPALPAGEYNINVTHALSGPAGVTETFTLPQQPFTVQAPEFFIDTTIVQTFYPPAGGLDTYDQKLPFLVLSDPSLPWERSLIPNSPPPNPASPEPWMALVIFAEGEILLPSNSNNPVNTCTVTQLLAPDPTNQVLKPQLPAGWVSADMLSATCQTITIPGAAFNAVMPSTEDLPYLAHCRGINTITEGEELLSVILCNRLAVTNASVVSAVPLRYYAHLVSLEGYGSYLQPNGNPIPSNPSGGLMNVQLVSLFNWTFVTQPEAGQSFKALVTGLIQSETTTQGALSLSLPVTVILPPSVQERLTDGYAPLTFLTGAGDQTFAWYRGPFSAVLPQALPKVGSQPVPIVQATSAEELMIYLSEQGLFDLSYSAAWNIGRNLALSNAKFAQDLWSFRLSANSALAILTQNMSLPHLSGDVNVKNLLAPNASRRAFASKVGNGLGQRWTATLAAVRQNPAPSPENVRRQVRSRKRVALHPRDILTQPGVVDAINENLSDIINSVSIWLSNLSMLYPLPFSYLVPDPRMLPVESIRFFYVDPNWTEALVAGAMSIAIHSSQDVAVYNALLPAFTANNGSDMSGMLIRSQLVSNCPKLVISATVDGAPVNILRNDCLAPNVRLVLFDGIPDVVTLAEPYQGLLFGVEDHGIMPRCVTSSALTGALIPNAPPVSPVFRTPPSGSAGGILQVAATVPSLATAVGIVAFDSKASVLLNGTSLKTTYVAGNQLNAIVPANLVATPGTAQVTVNCGGATSLPVNFIINAALEIDAINPTNIQAGGDQFILIVSGTGFAPASVIQWNGSPLATTVISTAEVTAVVPANLISAISSATITVLSAGVTSNPVPLAILGGDPVINSLQPNVAVAGNPGFTLTISGFGFTANAVAQWNGTNLTTTFLNKETLTAAVGAKLIANSGTISVTVMVNGTVSPAAQFTVAANQQQVIGSLQPNIAMAGGTNPVTLLVDGANFTSDAKVQWNGSPLASTFDDSGQLTASVPANLLIKGTASVSVTSSAGTSNVVLFTIIAPQPAIGLLEPGSVVAGSPQFTLTVTGGFGAGDFALQIVGAPELQSFIG